MDSETPRNAFTSVEPSGYVLVRWWASRMTVISASVPGESTGIGWASRRCQGQAPKKKPVTPVTIMSSRLMDDEPSVTRRPIGGVSGVGVGVGLGLGLALGL